MMREHQDINRTAHLLALMKKGDDAFNARDFAAVDAIHHPDMIAHITGNAQPIYGRAAHAAAMQQMLRIFPDMHLNTLTRFSSELPTGSQLSPAPPERSRAR
jgi:ketosteroid isomerase-like protein